LGAPAAAARRDPRDREDPLRVGWFVADGAAVQADQLLAEVQVDKVAAEVPAPRAGVVHLLVWEEAAVTQGTPIARID